MNRSILILAGSLLLAAATAIWFLAIKDKPVDSLEAEQTVGMPRHPDEFPVTLADKSQWDTLTRDDLPRHQRLEIARHISASHDSADAGTLFAALDHIPRSGAEEDWFVILNEIMEQMRRNGLGADQYSTRLGEIAADSSRPEVVRDYAIQHLALWIAPGNPAMVPHEENSELVDQSIRHIAAVIQDPTVSHTSISGTALLALADISANLPRESASAAWDSLEPYLNGVILGETPSHLSTRVSAIQAVALTRQPQYLPMIREFATSETTEPSIRLSSIAALGVYSRREDTLLLKNLASGDNFYNHAANSALRRLGESP